MLQSLNHLRAPARPVDRERLRANVSGLLALAAVALLLGLTACGWPSEKGCPRIPISFEPKP